MSEHAAEPEEYPFDDEHHPELPEADDPFWRGTRESTTETPEETRHWRAKHPARKPLHEGENDPED